MYARARIARSGRGDMSELRRGPITKEWVIIAPERGSRPIKCRRETAALPGRDPSTCPFCPGNEGLTPREIHRVDGPGRQWLVRVIPNKFPALQRHDGPGCRTLEGLFDRMSGVGAHEVIVEGPDHERQIPDLPDEHVRLIVDTCIDRVRNLLENRWHRYVLLFKNHGPKAGASLSHPHSQIIASPIVPRAVRDRLEMAEAYYERKGRCVFCDILHGETRSGIRVIEEANGYAVLAPYESRFPFELVIYPREHAHDFTIINDKQRSGLAVTLKRTLGRLRALLGDISYNLVLQTTPNLVSPNGKASDWMTLHRSYHWRIEIIPRLAEVAGFEWGTGLYINPTPPEDAARQLREVDIK